jgi:pimeloyl-ACP methyl ester carboxylesterase
MFTSINRWLAARGDRTDSRELGRFTKIASKATPAEFFSLFQPTRVQLRKDSEYPLTYSLRFDSQLPSGYSENDLVQGECLPSRPLHAPAVIVISGWLAGSRDYSRLANWVGLSGRNLWTMDYPYHARRKPDGTRSGELAVTSDLVRTLEAVRQAVVDVRTLIGALWELGSRDIAILGFSLGGWAGSLLGLTEPKISKALLVTPIVRPDELFLSSPFFSSLRENLKDKDNAGFFGPLNHLFLPINGTPVVDPQHIHLIGAHEDPLAAPGSLDELSSIWGCRNEILPGGHINLYFTLRLWRRIFTLLCAPFR